jgi:hypothetical protein
VVAGEFAEHAGKLLQPAGQPVGGSGDGVDTLGAAGGLERAAGLTVQVHADGAHANQEPDRDH